MKFLQIFANFVINPLIMSPHKPDSPLTPLSTLLRRSLISLFATLVFVLLSPLNLFVSYFSMRREQGLVTTLEEHDRRATQIQGQVRLWASPGGGKDRGQKMTTARPGWKSIAPMKTDKSSYFGVDVNLCQIVKLDVKDKTVTMEPGVMMGQITRYLAKRGWTLPVVPELETLTIGGLICGAGIETSSHKWGLFHDTVLSYEGVLPTGETFSCSKENDPDLFYSIPGSYATIAFLTAVTFPIIPAKRYVKVDYRSVSSIKEFYSLMKSEPNHDFVEGLAFSKDKIVLMFGDMDDGATSNTNFNTKTADKDIKVNHINAWYKKLYHRHAEAILNTRLTSSKSSFLEYIPLVDYYHRHSRGLFWIFEALTPVLYWRVVLLFLGWIHPFSNHFQIFLPRRILNYSAQSKIIQDYVVPMERAGEFYQAANGLLEIYPVWLCPLKLMKTGAMFHPTGEVDEDYLDIGYYGHPKVQGFNRVKTLKTLETLCIQFKGFQGLYADCYMSRSQFREMFDVSLYDKVRRERGCEAAFPDVYDKISAKARKLD